MDCSSNAWAYPKAIKRLWGTNFITVEGDVVVTREHLDELVACPRPRCAFAYKIPFDQGFVYPFRKQEFWEWIDRGEEDAQLVSLGCTKFSMEAQRFAFPDLDACIANPWANLDSHLSQAIRERIDPEDWPTIWHIHWPELIHNHG